MAPGPKQLVSINPSHASSHLVSSRSSEGATSSRRARSTSRHASSKSAKSASVVRPTKRQLLTLFRRLLILVAALFYVNVAIQGSVMSLRVLLGEERPRIPMLPYETKLAGVALGDTLVRDSPLVATLLKGDTMPRPQGSLYLSQAENGTLETSSDKCPSPSSVDGVYGDAFLRELFAALVRGTSYNLAFLDALSLELVVPFVDCTSTARVYEDATAATFLYLVRDKATPAIVSVLVVVLSNQGFKIESRNEMGSASVMTIALISDMTATSSVDHHFVLSLGYPFEPFDMLVYDHVETTPDNFWKLRSVPRNATTHVPKTLLTACRGGFYVKTESEQSNLSNALWALASDPQRVVTTVEWQGVPIRRDAWAWVHFVHLLLAWDVLFQVVVLLALIGRNLLAHKFWIGDAFVAISSSLVLRGGVVLLSMALNKFWALREFCLGDAAALSLASNYTVDSEIVHADLLTIFLSVVGLLGKLLQERIDPALAVLLFELGFHFRLAIVAWVPSMVEILAATALDDFLQSTITVDEAEVSPMKLWGVHELGSLHASFIASALFPVFVAMAPLVLLELVRKVLRRGWWGRRRIVVMIKTGRDESDRVTPFTTASDKDTEHEDENEDKGGTVVPAPPATTRTLLRTNFELATGARLADQFGLVGDYDNYLHIKGMRFASADGIYSNGFVIVNNKFLIQTADLPTIVAMKLLRIRFRNVYAYDVYHETHSVGEMARLVYPETMTLTDLASLNINVLT